MSIPEDLGPCESEHDDEREDAEVIVKIIKKHRDVDLTVDQAGHFWEWHSDDYDAGWLSGARFSPSVLMWFDRWVERNYPRKRS